MRERFCFTPRRRQLFEGLTSYLARTAALGNPPALQLLGGSFVDDKPDPNDVDIANIVDAVPAEAMPLYYDRPLILRTYGVDPLTLPLSGKSLRDGTALIRIACYYSYRREDGRQRALILLKPPREPEP